MLLARERIKFSGEDGTLRGNLDAMFFFDEGSQARGGFAIPVLSMFSRRISDHDALFHLRANVSMFQKFHTHTHANTHTICYCCSNDNSRRMLFVRENISEIRERVTKNLSR